MGEGALVSNEGELWGKRRWHHLPGGWGRGGVGPNCDWASNSLSDLGQVLSPARPQPPYRSDEHRTRCSYASSTNG